MGQSSSGLINLRTLAKSILQILQNLVAMLIDKCNHMPGAADAEA